MINVKIAPMPDIVRITFFVATIIFGLTLTFTLRRVLEPLTQASRAAVLITPRNRTTRLSSEGIPSEIKPLIGAFNEALGRLENGFTVQQQFLASAAHELQTPLTLIRGQIELQPEIESKELLFREIGRAKDRPYRRFHRGTAVSCRSCSSSLTAGLGKIP
ncbi:histidine kinase dimerization/phospho-acceptor domain-containing protein [Paraburkholderia lacunae]|uniref:histidine kinase dimerization/phospho-acceptor domain-containing protein n=1 Tax=Paraburkholderia lacunae TaxID=2211104 RepID=UPI0026D221E6